MTPGRAAFYGLLLLCSGAFAAVVGGHSARFLFGCCLAVAAYAVVAAFAMSGRIGMELRLRKNVLIAGDDLEVELAVRLPFSFPLVWLVVEDRWLKAGSPPIVRRRLLLPAGRREVRFCSTLAGLPRGVYRHGGCRIEVGDLFHAAVRSVRLASRDAAVRPVTVLPRPLGGDWYAGGTARAEDQTAIGSVREYRPGDPLNRIDWKSCARSGKWRTKEPDKANANPPELLIDDAERDRRRFERLIAAAARIVTTVPEGAGGAGGLRLRCGNRALPAAADRRTVLAWLAALDQAEGVPLAQSLRELPARTEPGRPVIAVTAAPDSPLLQLAGQFGKARRSPLELVYVAPGASLSREERTLLGRFAAVGWRVVVAPGDLAAPTAAMRSEAEYG